MGEGTNYIYQAYKIQMSSDRLKIYSLVDNINMIW